MSQHDKYKYSIAIFSDDLAIVNCLRALSKFSQKTGNNNIPWGGTKDKDWIGNNHIVTFHFSEPAYRNGFVSELKRLLPRNLWEEKKRSDNDPATPVY